MLIILKYWLWYHLSTQIFYLTTFKVYPFNEEQNSKNQNDYIIVGDFH